MIVKMKKATVIVMESLKDKALEEMRQSGVLHINTEQRENQQINLLQKQINYLERACQALEESTAQDAPSLASEEELFNQLEDFLAAQESTRQIQEEIQKINKEIAFWQPWGNLDSGDLERLAKASLEVQLFRIPSAAWKKLKHTEGLFAIGPASNPQRAVLFSQEADQFSELKEEWQEKLPEKSLVELKNQKDSLENELQQQRELSAKTAAFKEAFEKELAKKKEELEYQLVRENMDTEESLALISGYLPAEDLTEFEKKAAAQGWGLLVDDPLPSDPVPTKIKSHPLSKIIQPVFALLGTIPGYRERDISLVFLIFFALFFAMIVGDGGYGLAFVGMGLAGLFKRNSGETLKTTFKLLLIMGISTVIWGAITGTWFGSQAIAELPVFSAMIIPQIHSFNPDSTETVMLLCFIIGALQLGLAYLWNFLRIIRSKHPLQAFAQLGWFSLVFGLFWLVLNLVLGQNYPLPDFSLYAIAGGLAAVFIFSEQDGCNFFLGIAKGFGNFITNFLDSINVFANIISYIRLFAVGLASVEIAKSFNSMAAGIGFEGPALIGAVPILILGHGLNFAMAALSILVHGVRLNMLEFSGALGMEWTGQTYRPFKKSGEKPEEA